MMMMMGRCGVGEACTIVTSWRVAVVLLCLEMLCAVFFLNGRMCSDGG